VSIDISLEVNQKVKMIAARKRRAGFRAAGCALKFHADGV
jgi:hypothetical protein